MEGDHETKGDFVSDCSQRGQSQQQEILIAVFTNGLESGLKSSMPGYLCPVKKSELQANRLPFA